MIALEARLNAHFEESIALKTQAASYLVPKLATGVNLIKAALSQGKKVLACGNGGSAADAQHFAAELIGRFEAERKALPAIALTTDTSILTAVANDYAFDTVFARQVQGLGQAGDVLLAISTSGNSKNVLAAIEAAHALNMRVIALTGKGGGKMAQVLSLQDLLLDVPHARTARIQEVHILALHCLCDGIDAD